MMPINNLQERKKNENNKSYFVMRPAFINQ